MQAVHRMDHADLINDLTNLISLEMADKMNIDLLLIVRIIFFQQLLCSVFAEEMDPICNGLVDQLRSDGLGHCHQGHFIWVSAAVDGSLSDGFQKLFRISSYMAI